MTEVKSLIEASIALQLDDKATDFLTNPYRDKFMTEFIVGNNKLKFYGNPIIMAQNSELIKTSLPKFAESKAPYELATFGVVLERPLHYFGCK